MKKTVWLKNIIKERLEKIISIRKKEIWVYKLKINMDWKKIFWVIKDFTIDFVRLIVIIFTLLMNIAILIVWYLILTGLKIDKFLFTKKQKWE